MKPRIAITSGDPAGIGPDIILQTLIENHQWQQDMVVIADPVLIQSRAEQLGLSVNIQQYQTNQTTRASSDNAITVLPVKCAIPNTAGKLNVENASYVLDTLTTAAKGCQSDEFSAMVTAPIHKGIINEAGIPFSGHTEFLAELTETSLPVMMLAADKLRVALATTHLPISDVSQAITPRLLKDIIRILDHDLKTKFAIKQPHILVCGLNPHASEGGHIGDEDIVTVAPTLELLRDEGINLTGPLPADTLFTPKYLDTADAVLAMYHDQGLPVLKYVGFGNAINITLGLPIIRTSVDHGTAIDLAGTGKANNGSLIAAIKLAEELVH